MRRFPRPCVMALLVAVVVALGRPADAGPDAKVITYSVKGKGNASDLEAFAAIAVTTYADPRGWSLGGSIRFDRVADGGDFTLWLAADALMSTFGGACDVIWSCRNGRHVVINEDRWLGASDAWNAAGGGLAAYRQMVLNHETGHWLGFGHGHCSGVGAAAPVMQQQSMSLGACRFNSWPLPAERAQLARRRGATVVEPGSVDDDPAATTSTTRTTRPAPTTTTTMAGPAGGSARGVHLPAPTDTTARRPVTGFSQSVPLENRCLARMPDTALRPWRRCF